MEGYATMQPPCPVVLYPFFLGAMVWGAVYTILEHALAKYILDTGVRLQAM